MESYAYGDYVVHETHWGCEVGRVTCMGYAGNAFVCYGQGCTAACTPLRTLRPATAREVALAPKGIGHHRFDATCPERDDEVCGMCRARKAVSA